VTAKKTKLPKFEDGGTVTNDPDGTADPDGMLYAEPTVERTDERDAAANESLGPVDATGAPISAPAGNVPAPQAYASEAAIRQMPGYDPPATPAPSGNAQISAMPGYNTGGAAPNPASTQAPWNTATAVKALGPPPTYQRPGLGRRGLAAIEAGMGGLLNSRAGRPGGITHPVDFSQGVQNILGVTGYQRELGNWQNKAKVAEYEDTQQEKAQEAYMRKLEADSRIAEAGARDRYYGMSAEAMAAQRDATRQFTNERMQDQWGANHVIGMPQEASTDQPAQLQPSPAADLTSPPASQPPGWQGPQLPPSDGLDLNQMPLASSRGVGSGATMQTPASPPASNIPGAYTPDSMPSWMGNQPAGAQAFRVSPAQKAALTAQGQQESRQTPVTQEMIDDLQRAGVTVPWKDGQLVPASEVNAAIHSMAKANQPAPPAKPPSNATELEMIAADPKDPRQAQAIAALKQEIVQKRAGATQISNGVGGATPYLAEAIAHYKQAFPMTRISGQKGGNTAVEADALMKQVLAINPKYRVEQFNAFNKMETNATSGDIGKKSNALGTMIGHAGTLSQAADGLEAAGHGNFKPLNAMANFVGVQTGKDPITTYKAIVKRLGPEITAAYITGGGTAGERGTNEEDFDPNLGMQQIRSNIGITAYLAGSKIDANQRQYNAGTYGYGEQKLLSDETEAQRQKLIQFLPPNMRPHAASAGASAGASGGGSQTLPTISGPTDPKFVALPKGARFLSNGQEMVKH